MGQNNGLKSSTNRRQLLPKPRQVNPRLSAAVGLKRSKTTHYFWIARRRTRPRASLVSGDSTMNG